MKRSKFTEEQIIVVLREQEAGVTTAEVCRRHGISSATFYAWKSKYGGMDVSDAKRLKTVEEENAKVKRLLADAMLDSEPSCAIDGVDGPRLRHRDVPGWGLLATSTRGEPSMEHPITIGLDLAKSAFQVHGVAADGGVVVRRQLRRSQVVLFFSHLEPCLVETEACAGAHHWARELMALGHEVRLMPPAYVKPFVKTGKTDAADAEAICEAVTRPTMRFE